MAYKGLNKFCTCLSYLDLILCLNLNLKKCTLIFYFHNVIFQRVFKDIGSLIIIHVIVTIIKCLFCNITLVDLELVTFGALKVKYTRNQLLIPHPSEGKVSVK